MASASTEKVNEKSNPVSALHSVCVCVVCVCLLAEAKRCNEAAAEAGSGHDSCQRAMHVRQAAKRKCLAPTPTPIHTFTHIHTRIHFLV